MLRKLKNTIVTPAVAAYSAPQKKEFPDIVLFLSALLMIVCLLAPFYGVLPIKNVHSQGLIYPALGNIECITRNKLTTPCLNSGMPLGSYLTTGLSFAYLASMVQLVSGLPANEAYNLIAILFLCLGWGGIFMLIRVLGGNRFFSLFGGFFFLLMPIVWGKTSYAFLMWGSAVLPFFIWLDIWFFRTNKFIVSIPAVFLSKSFLLFLEPYTFVMASLFTAAILTYEIIVALKKKKPSFELFLKILVVVTALLGALFLYKAYIPGGAAYGTMPLDHFRGQGIDLVAFFNRPNHMYAAGQFWNVSIPNPRLFYTDGESVSNVYLGIGFMVALFLLMIYRARIRFHHWLLFGVGIIAFVLALGPSLKINNTRDLSQIKTKYMTCGDYRMPEEAATLSMPHAFIYRLAPFKHMRSVSRWYLLVVVAFVVTLMVLLTFSWNQGRRGKALALLIMVWIIFEYAPDIKYKMAQIKRNTADFSLFNSTAVDELKRAIKPGETVFFLQHAGPDNNEYLSTYLCSMAQCRAYNVSTDKALDMVRRRWPAEVRNVVTKPDKESVLKLLKSRLVSVVVFPHFDMRWDSYKWPPDQTTKNSFSQAGDEYRDEGQSVKIDKREWFSFFRLKPEDESVSGGKK